MSPVKIHFQSQWTTLGQTPDFKNHETQHFTNKKLKVILHTNKHLSNQFSSKDFFFFLNIEWKSIQGPTKQCEKNPSVKMWSSWRTKTTVTTKEKRICQYEHFCFSTKTWSRAYCGQYMEDHMRLANQNENWLSSLLWLRHSLAHMEYSMDTTYSMFSS